MTRETKIGLLVGLAFIIVIGILLSDHLTSSTEPPPAVLAQAGNNVRQTTTTPGGSGAQSNATPTGPMSPTSQVPTGNELNQPPKQPPVTIVNVGPGQSSPSGSSQSPVVIGSSSPNSENAGQAPVQAPERTTEIAGAPQPPTDTSLHSTARQIGEEIVPVDGSGRAIPNARPANWTTALTGMKEYKAEPGDSVGKMASRFMGGNTKANRDAIVKANPTLQSDPNRVIAGRTYAIPSAGTTDTPAATNAPADSAAQPATASNTEYWYTVKEGDSLWKIAVDQCGKGSAVAAIKELNKDTLKGSDTVIVNMKLRLPGKPVAVAKN